MRNRLRKARRAMVDGVAAIGRFIAKEIGRDELALYGGLALVSYGLWGIWRPGAFLVTGAVLVWMALPSRPMFVERPPAMVRRARKD